MSSQVMNVEWKKSKSFDKIKWPKSEQAKSEQAKSEQAKSEQAKSKQPKSKKPKFPQTTVSSMEQFFVCCMMNIWCRIHDTCIYLRLKNTGSVNGRSTMLYLSATKALKSCLFCLFVCCFCFCFFLKLKISTPKVSPTEKASIATSEAYAVKTGLFDTNRQVQQLKVLWNKWEVLLRLFKWHPRVGLRRVLFRSTAHVRAWVSER